MTIFPSDIEMFGGAMAVSVLVAIVLSVVWFAVSLIKRRNDVADIGWATYFIAIAAVIYAMSADRLADWRLIPLVLVLIWGIRLSFHIAKRHSHSPEDARYVAWRNAWGNGGYFYVRSYLQVFFLQSLLATVIATPVTIAMVFGFDAVPWWIIVIGITAWIKGYLFESFADRQLRDFLANPENRGNIMDRGLWRYSRHPNYFGESLQWWGLWIMTIGMPYWYVGIIGPLTITFLIRFVSGVPLAEKMMAANPAFAEYKKRTSVFIPWFVKK